MITNIARQTKSTLVSETSFYPAIITSNVRKSSRAGLINFVDTYFSDGPGLPQQV